MKPELPKPTTGKNTGLIGPEEIEILEMGKTIIQTKILSFDVLFSLNAESLNISNIKTLDSFDTCSIIGANYAAGKLLNLYKYSIRTLYWLKEFFKMEHDKRDRIMLVNWKPEKKEALDFIDFVIKTVKTRKYF